MKLPGITDETARRSSTAPVQVEGRAHQEVDPHEDRVRKGPESDRRTAGEEREMKSDKAPETKAAETTTTTTPESK